MRTAIEKIREHAMNFPERLAVVFEEGTLTYGQLWESSLRLSDFFRRSGVGKGDCVVCQSVYTRWYAVVCYAAHLCGAAFVPVDKNVSGEIIAQTARQLNARCVVAKQKMPDSGLWLTFSELEGCMESGSVDADVTMPGLDDPACIMFTTGTTGKPKGVVLSHRSLTASGDVRYETGLLSEGNVFLTIVPVNHVAPMWRLFAHGYYGGTVIYLDGILKLKKMYEYIEKYGVTTLYLPPSAIGAIAQFGSDRLARYADQIQTMGIASAAISETQVQFITQALPKTMILFKYGASEFGWVCGCRLRGDGSVPVNCIGKPHPQVCVRIVDDNMQDVPTGEHGILIAKSDMNFSGYWNNPELTQQSLYDGFVVSSDLAYFDKAGNVYLAGRRDDIINIGGLKVFPTEIENEAEKIPGVTECICFKVPDTITGQAAKLLLVMSEASDMTLAQLRRELMQKLDPYKVPKYIEFVGHIERTANGKPNRKHYEHREAALV